MSDTSEQRQQDGSSSASVAMESTTRDPTPILYAPEEQRESLVREYFRTLARYRWLILGFALIGAVVCVLIDLDAMPVYRSRTSLDIQSLNNDFMDMRFVAPTGDPSDSSSDAYVQTQIKLLQSESLLDRTVQHMRADPHPAFLERMDLVSRVERALHLVRHKPLPYEDLIDEGAKHITVKPLGATRLVEITCDSWNPEFSAKLCNTLVEQFKEADLEVRAAESQKTSDWLVKQVADVKQKVEDSQKRLKEATGGDGLILSPGNTGVEEDHLRELQDQYVRAQADRMESEARASIATSSMVDLEQSPAYQQDAVKLAELQSEVAKLVPPLTEENPQVIHLRSQIKAIQSSMAAERNSNAAHLKSQYQASVERENMLANAYRREMASVSAEFGKASEVSLLRGEVESEQQLYQTLLQRAREAGFASAMRASTVRVVDRAKPNSAPVFPRRGNSAGSGLLMGTVCGVGLAFIFERTTTLVRAPGDSERCLGIPELGVIPTSVKENELLESTASGGRGEPDLESPKEAGPALCNWESGFSIVAEAYRSTTTSIMLSESRRQTGRIYVVSSPNPAEGKTTVISNIGVALSKSRLRVLLIDGDLRKPGLHKMLNVSNDFGFRNLLRGEADGDGPRGEQPLYQSTVLPNLFVLPAGAGTEDVVELLYSPTTANVLERFRNDFDVVLVDTPPMIHMADARILASHAQGAILLIRAGKTRRDEATKARDLFTRDGVRLIGTILNDFDPKRSGLDDYYRSYERYMAGDEAGERGASWLEWLFTRERWLRNRVAVKAAVNHTTTVSATVLPNSEASAPDAEPSTEVYGEIIAPPQPNRFLKVFGWSSNSEEGERANGEPHREDQQHFDRRRADRQDAPELVAYCWEGGTSRPHEVRDISSNGVYLVTDIRWYPGTQILLNLQRTWMEPNQLHRSISVRARVIRHGLDGLGLAFVMDDHLPAAKRPRASRESVAFGHHAADTLVARGADQMTFDNFLQHTARDGTEG